MWKCCGQRQGQDGRTTEMNSLCGNSGVPQWPSIASPPLLLSLPQMEALCAYACITYKALCLCVGRASLLCVWPAAAARAKRGHTALLHTTHTTHTHTIILLRSSLYI